MSAAPVSIASFAGPAGIRVGSPKNVTARRAGPNPLAEQADDPTCAQPLGQFAERRLLPARQREDLEPPRDSR